MLSSALGKYPRQFLSTPSARRATMCSTPRSRRYTFLSTPSARRATCFWMSLTTSSKNFYPRPPRGGRPRCACRSRSGNYFYPRPPRGGRRSTLRRMQDHRKISIHALREEGDPSLPDAAHYRNAFLSTPSARRATEVKKGVNIVFEFLSTPSARRATPSSTSSPPKEDHFYPRPPRGGRQQKQRQKLYFQTNYTTFCTNLEEP